MSELPIDANICKMNGPYYPMKLNAVPHAGGLVQLFSFVHQAAKLKATEGELN